MKEGLVMKKKIVVAFIVLMGTIVSFLAIMTLLEYRPKDTESLTILGDAVETSLVLNKDYSVSSFNIGYGALGETEDFFMDGGETVRPKNKEMVESNIGFIKEKLIDLNSDFYLLQEVDEDSKRSYGTNQVEALLLDDMQGSFAYNFKVKYVPFPLPTIGKVNSGILSMGAYRIKSTERISLPNPFSWPVRTVNLKRAMQITRYPIQDRENAFVLINFHLEAFDSGEGKREQTKLLSKIISEEYNKGNFVIAGGDWNQTLIKDFVLDENLLTEWQPGVLDWELLPGWQIGVDLKMPTNRSLLMPYVGNKEKLALFFIDGFIVSPNIQIVETAVQGMDFKYSDHEPVKMVFKLLE